MRETRFLLNRRRKRIRRAYAAAALMLMIVPCSHAQTGSLTVSAAPGAIAFDLAPNGTASGSSPITVTTDWLIVSLGGATIDVYASFGSAATALSDGNGHHIPSARVQGRVVTGVPTTFSPFTEANPFGAVGSSLHLLTQSVDIANLTGTRDDNLEIQIDLTGGFQIPPGEFSGTLTIQAQAL